MFIVNNLRLDINAGQVATSGSGVTYSGATDTVTDCRVQPTVTFPIGDHVNDLPDYKKTGP